MNRSGKYELMKREYVLGDDNVTLRALGDKYGRSAGSVGRIAKLEGWLALRHEHRAKVADEVDSQLTSGVVGKLVSLREKFIDAAEKSIDRYIEAVDSKQITPNATDIAKLAATARELVVGGTEGASEGNGDGIRISEALGHDFFRALESVARSRTESGSVEKPARPELVGTSG